MYDKHVLITQLSNGNAEDYKLKLLSQFEKQCIFFGYDDGWSRALNLLRRIKERRKYMLNIDKSKFIDQLREEINGNSKNNI
jgi:hypothetical protein